MSSAGDGLTTLRRTHQMEVEFTLPVRSKESSLPFGTMPSTSICSSECSFVPVTKGCCLVPSSGLLVLAFGLTSNVSTRGQRQGIANAPAQASWQGFCGARGVGVGVVGSVNTKELEIRSRPLCKNM